MPTSVFQALPKLLQRHGVEPRGVLHVGGHRGEESAVYRRCGFSAVTWVEPNPNLNIDGDVVRKAIGQTPGTRRLHLTRNSQTSSLLRPLKNGRGAVDVEVVRLADVDTDANVLVVDVQGAELDVLRSDDLARFDLVVVETCDETRYEGQPTPHQIDGRMSECGFRPVGTFPHRKAVIVDRVYVR